MAAATLDHVQQLVDQLSPLEQVKLLEYLSSRIARAVAQQQTPTVARSQYEDAWAELFHVGDAIAASDTNEAATLTSSVLSMRR